ncbi:MAG: hypothetical protein MSA54_03180 [Campylobacter sp.]|uniref:hypothetical protein n=1 Tax=Campylobacter sp. TaxID=205 RepID=UPI002AA8F7D0|nr:hypothetical protein [Campylobacter sp.]MCI7500935.1 hypothetical protein [Campylobacter sp.]
MKDKSKKWNFIPTFLPLCQIIRILELNESEVEFTWDTSAKYYESLIRIAIIAKID